MENKWEYQIVYNTKLPVMEEHVQAMLNNGYELSGPLIVTVINADCFEFAYHQAFVKRVPVFMKKQHDDPRKW